MYVFECFTTKFLSSLGWWVHWSQKSNISPEEGLKNNYICEPNTHTKRDNNCAIVMLQTIVVLVAPHSNLFWSPLNWFPVVLQREQTTRLCWNFAFWSWQLKANCWFISHIKLIHDLFKIFFRSPIKCQLIRYKNGRLLLNKPLAKFLCDSIILHLNNF